MKEAIEKHWSRDAGSYNKSVQTALRSEKTKGPWKDIFSRVLGTSQLNILDVGTGPGSVALLLAEMGHRVTGVDFSEAMIENAMRNNTALGLDVNFKKGDAENLPFADGTFDAVVNRFVLWTAPDPKKAIQEWKRVLKPDGKLVIIDGNWYGNRNTLKRRIWRELSLPLVMITERRNPYTHKFGPELKKGIWCLGVERPEADKIFLEEESFRDIYLIEEINTERPTLFEYLKYGYQEKAFMIAGSKKSIR